MKNYKSIGWIEAIQSRIDGNLCEGLYHTDCACLSPEHLSINSFKEHTMTNNSSQEISKIPV